VIFARRQDARRVEADPDSRLWSVEEPGRLIGPESGQMKTANHGSGMGDGSDPGVRWRARRASNPQPS